MENKCRWHHGGFGCGAWIAGWLFALGYLQLPVLKGILALLLWPYYLGSAWAGF